MGLGDYMDYEKLAREIAEEAHCRYCDFNATYRTKCSGDIRDTAKHIAQALESAALEGEEHGIIQVTIRNEADFLHVQKRRAALRKRLEELNGKV